MTETTHYSVHPVLFENGSWQPLWLVFTPEKPNLNTISWAIFKDDNQGNSTLELITYADYQFAFDECHRLNGAIHGYLSDADLKLHLESLEDLV